MGTSVMWKTSVRFYYSLLSLSLSLSLFSLSPTHSYILLVGTPAPMSASRMGRSRAPLEEFEDEDSLIPKSRSRVKAGAAGGKERGGSRLQGERTQVNEVKNVMAENLNVRLPPLSYPHLNLS